MRNYLLATVAALSFAAAGTAQAARFAETDATRDSSAFSALQGKPAPGKVIVRVGGNVWVDVGVGGGTLFKSSTNGAKQQNFGMMGGMRLYFGVDGQLANGLLYGANLETRTNSVAAVGAGASGNSTANTLYFRRAYVYLSGPSWGLVRMGQGDGPMSLFTGNTTGEFFSTGGWDGDAPGLLGNAGLAWPFPVVGNEYTSNKITYVSPTFGGFTVGLSYAPNQDTLTGGTGASANLGGTSLQSASTLAGDFARPRNTVELGARYSDKLGAVGVYGVLGYSLSGKVDNVSGAGAQFNNLSVFDGGVALDIAGFQPFAHITTGKMNGAYTLQQKLVGRSKDGLAWTAGAAYGQGPWIVGASYYSFDSQGSSAGTGNRQERGIHVGGNYALTNGLDLYADFITGTRKQAGFNFEAGAAGAARNTVNSTAFTVTTQVRW